VPLVRRVGAALALIGLCLPVQAAHAAAERPNKQALTAEGSTERFLLDGTWLLKRDPGDDGIARRWYAQRSASGWEPVTVPHAYNAGDDSAESMGGSVTWYRKDFRLPDASRGLAWIARFESARYRATVWLNGRQVGRHVGGYVPFGVRLSGLSLRGTNRLVVRVDNRRQATDLPPSRLTADGVPSGGWWNYGGLLRPVYLKRVNRVDLTDVEVTPELGCRTCDARIRFSATVRNYLGRSQRVSVGGTFGTQRVSLGSATVGAGSRRTLSGSIQVSDPHLWSPADPFLYKVELGARVGGRQVAGYELLSGIRSLTVADGRLQLNHAPVNLRGGFFHEDHPVSGGALTTADVDALIAQTKSLGATALRSHYPLGSYLLEQADRQGLLVWQEIPVYQIPGSVLKRTEVRRLAARLMRETIAAGKNHASVMTWGVGNELDSEPTSIEHSYFRSIANVVRQEDRSRPVSYVSQSYPRSGCQIAFQYFDMIGYNTYFGWYPGPNGSTADRVLLSGYLDEIRACYPDKALMVTEFGAEANRHGPAEVRGTYEFQQEWLNYTLGVFAEKPWLSGALVMLREFRARPGWNGGNPRPLPPLHQKGILDYNGNPKPAAADVARWFQGTRQYDLGARR
jgi:beta-glucuronidase